MIEQGKPYTHIYNVLAQSVKAILLQKPSLSPQVLNAVRLLNQYHSVSLPTLASLMKLPRHEDVLFEHLPNGFVWMKSYIQTSHESLSPQKRDVLAAHLSHGDLKGAIEFVKRHITEAQSELSDGSDESLVRMWSNWLAQAESLLRVYDALDTMEAFLMASFDLDAVPKNNQGAEDEAEHEDDETEDDA